jgi:hypothetical protein
MGGRGGSVAGTAWTEKKKLPIATASITQTSLLRVMLIKLLDWKAGNDAHVVSHLPTFFILIDLMA